ncbi:MAG: hypothetical protein AVDCRST_MAG96-3900 [uncultured Segetibacter sp.]|uniref:Uncharacterized protein n=1 Tax=uncultured Segetibacter sp. TaxID=481133 RepID=A0A6J4TYG4_9BACT|nr:MAG: hypothetical protein AVDCRST_MAG96-3900 [uncultured Segetibacter sp.]
MKKNIFNPLSYFVLVITIPGGLIGGTLLSLSSSSPFSVSG